MKRGGLPRDHAVPLRRQALEERSGCKSVAPAPQADKKARKSFFSSLFQFHNWRTSVQRYCRFLPSDVVRDGA
jgi:hypothetical protein